MQSPDHPLVTPHLAGKRMISSIRPSPFGLKGAKAEETSTPPAPKPEKPKPEKPQEPSQGEKAFHPTEYTPSLYRGLDKDGDEEKQLIPVPDIRQPDDYSCGACVAMSVGHFYKVGPQELEEWKKALGTNRATSTHPYAIRDYLKSLGLYVEDKHEMSLEDLYDNWERGLPTIIPLQEYGDPTKEEKHPEEETKGDKPKFDYGHYVIHVGGPALGMIFVQDPSHTNIEEGTDPETHGLPNGLIDKAIDYLFSIESEAETQ